MSEEERNWVWGILEKTPFPAGSFLTAFAEAVIRADSDNLAILLPAIEQIRAKYPRL